MDERDEDATLRHSRRRLVSARAELGFAREAWRLLLCAWITQPFGGMDLATAA